MKKSLNAFWIISSIFLAVGALWGVISGLANVMGQYTVCGVVLVIFGVISFLAFFSAGVKSGGSGWLLFDAVTSFFTGLAFIFSYVDSALFTVDIIFILGLWLVFLGISQIARASHFGKSIGKVLMTGTGVLGVLGGLSLYIRPISNFLLISEGFKLCGYNITFLLLFASLIVLSRVFSKK
ncbi:MAG: hypothetical protein ACI4GZ_06195 [Ruminococcus sp.]